MIIARGQTDKGGELLLVGLSRENVNRLTGSVRGIGDASSAEGEPIRMSRESHGDGVPEGWEILIFFGETEASMRRDLELAGAISKDTKVTVDPRL